MRLGVLAGSIARVIEHRRRRRGAAERAIVAHINPTSPGVSLALGQDRYSRVIAVQSVGCEDMGFKAPEDRFQYLSLIHISEPTRLGMISYAVFCLKKKKK